MVQFRRGYDSRVKTLQQLLSKYDYDHEMHFGASLTHPSLCIVHTHIISYPRVVCWLEEVQHGVLEEHATEVIAVWRGDVALPNAPLQAVYSTVYICFFLVFF